MPSSAVGALCERWRTRVPAIAICRALAEAFPDLEAMAPPIDLRRLATIRRIRSIETAAIETDGLILTTNDGELAVQVRSTLSKARRRFTIAHEIAHTLFFELEQQPNHHENPDPSTLLRHDSSDVESLCNVAASEILMPRRQFVDTAQQFGPSAAALARLAAMFGVSLHAAANRMAELSPVRVAAMLWARTGDQFFTSVWRAGRTGVTSEELILTPEDPAFSLLASEERFRQRVWISLGGPLDNYFVDGMPLRGPRERRVLTLFILHPQAETLAARQIEMPEEGDQLELA